MSGKGMRFRPMLVGDVARVAGDPRETIRTRLKQGIFGFERPKGWKRFSDFETIVIGIHARLKRATRDDDLAKLGCLLVAKALMDEWIEDKNGIPYFAEETFHGERFLVFWRRKDDAWKGEIFNSHEAVLDETETRFEESETVAPAFTIINLRTFMRQTLLALMEVAVEIEEAKSGGKQ